MKKIIKKFPFILGLVRWIRDNGLSKRPAVETPFGFKFVGLRAMQEGNFEVDETNLFRNLLKSSDLFVNIGANTGYYCCFSLQAGKETIAFEPNEMNLRVLFRNAKENGWEKEIEVFPVALSNNKGLATFYGTGLLGSLVKGWSNNPDQISRTVPLNTLNELVARRVNGKSTLIVMDVEGAELSVLQGGDQVLEAKPKPIWMVEANIGVHFVGKESSNPELLPLFERFWMAGYEAWTATEQPRLVERKELEAIHAGGEDTIGTHNFLFVGKDFDLPLG